MSFNTIRQVFAGTLLLCLVFAAVVVVRTYVRLNDTLTARATAEIAKRFPGLQVSIDSVEILDSRKIRCRRLVLSEAPHPGWKTRPVFEVEEVIVHGPFSVSDYLENNIAIETVELNRPRLFLTRDERGNIREWDFFPKKSEKTHELSLRVHQGTIQIDDTSVENVNLSFYPEKRETSAETSGESVEKTAGGIRFQGNAAANWCRAIQLDGFLNPETRQWGLKGRVRELAVDQDFWRQRDIRRFCETFLKSGSETIRATASDEGETKELRVGIQQVSHDAPQTRSTPVEGTEIRDLENTLRSIRGRCSMNFDLVGDDTAPSGVRGEASGVFTEGRIHLDLFKHPFSDLRLQFHFTGEALEVRHCAATYGDTRVYLIYKQPHLDRLEDAELYLKTEQMNIDREMISRLRPFSAENIDRFLSTFKSFSVTADVEMAVRRKNRRWTFHDVTFKGKNLNLAYSDSLYPLDELQGALHLDRHGTLAFDFSTDEGEESIPTFEPPAFEQPGADAQHYPPVPSTAFMHAVDGPVAVEEDVSRPEEIVDFRDDRQHAPRPSGPLREFPRHRAATDGKSVRIRGRFEGFPQAPQGELTIRASGIPINAKLIDTIPERQRRVVRSLHPEGTVSAFVSLRFPGDKAQGVQKYFAVGAENCSICYDLFPYPIRGIDGIIEWNGENWRFLNFTGDNESTKVRAEGNMNLQAEGLVFSLRVNATDLPLEGPLRDALLNESHREIHQSLRGTGNIDVDARISYYPRYKKLFVSFDAEPDKRTGLTIRPVNFPLRIENVRGNIHYDNGNITVRNLKGRNKDAKVSSDVTCRFHDNGSWTMDISPIVVDQVHVQDPDLLKAMPENLQVLVKTFDLKEPINVDGAVRFSRDARGAPLRSQWNATLNLFQNSANLGLPVRHIGGQLHLRGLSEDSRLNVSGELDLDSIFVHDIQMRDISGPFHYDGEKVRLGQDVATEDFVFRPVPHDVSPANRSPDRSRRYLGQVPDAQVSDAPIPGTRISDAPFDPYATPQTNAPHDRRVLPYTPPEARPITAKVFGGTASCRGHVHVRHKNISYNMNLGLVKGDLTSAVRELRSGREKGGGVGGRKISGRLDMTANLFGEGRNPDTLSGEGRIALSNAYLYETPMMLQLLQILSIREPDANAFSKSEIQFRLQGKKMLFNKVKFEGTAFSLEGNGDLQLDANRQLSLILKTKLGDHRNRIPLVSDIIRGVGGELNDIHVEGTLDAPEIVANPLPRMRRAIEQIQGMP